MYDEPEDILSWLEESAGLDSTLLKPEAGRHRLVEDTLMWLETTSRSGRAL
jgi:hypothetical protein